MVLTADLFYDEDGATSWKAVLDKLSPLAPGVAEKTERVKYEDSEETEEEEHIMSQFADVIDALMEKYVPPPANHLSPIRTISCRDYAVNGCYPVCASASIK